MVSVEPIPIGSATFAVTILTWSAGENVVGRFATGPIVSRYVSVPSVKVASAKGVVTDPLICTSCALIGPVTDTTPADVGAVICEHTLDASTVPVQPTTPGVPVRLAGSAMAKLSAPPTFTTHSPKSMSETFAAASAAPVLKSVAIVAVACAFA